MSRGVVLAIELGLVKIPIDMLPHPAPLKFIERLLRLDTRNLMSSPQRRVSDSMSAANAAGALAAAEIPNFSNCARTWGSSSAWATAAANFSRTASGVPDGAPRPHQFDTFRPGTPDSAADGASG